jgi:hypothetical protein
MLSVKRLLRRFSLAVLAIAVLSLGVMPGTLAAQIHSLLAVESFCIDND